MASLFLSYSRQDSSRVEPLAAALEQEGHEVWWDRHISGGEEFADAIERELESADVIIACWTERSIHSGNCLRPFQPFVGFSPTRPHHPAGIRIEPPPSVAVAIGAIPAAIAAPEPPEEPPGEASRFQGFRVGP